MVFTFKNIVYLQLFQTSSLKFRRDGTLPTKFTGLKDSNDGPTVKLVLFGDGANKTIDEGEVIKVTNTFKWKITDTLSTKKTLKVEVACSFS